MKRPIVYLTLLLLVQLGLTFALHSGNRGPADANHQEPLLKLATAQVDAIELSGGDQHTLTLNKIADGWSLPEHFAAKADAAKVDKLLATLGGLTRPWPVAKTATAGKRFKVDEQNFERKLVFRSQGKPLATLLLGSSPGFRKVHARLEGEAQIYDIPFSTFQASLKPEDWIDRQQLQLKAAEVSAIELPGCRLTRRDGKIQLEQLADSEQTNQEQAQQLLQQLADLQIRDIHSKADQPLPNPVELRVKLTLKDGGSREYGFAKGDKSGYELLQVADAPYLYEVNSGLIEQLKQFDRGKLAEAKPASLPAEPEKGTPATGQQPG
jgi:Domain of unknown function (DUF4340)